MACLAPGQRVIEVTRGQDVRNAVREHEPDVTVLDMQIGNMGGIAVSIDLRLEASAGRVPDVAILLLLDREADRFLAKRGDADAELVKPIDPATLRRTIDGLLGSLRSRPGAGAGDQEVDGDAVTASTREPEPVDG